MPLFKTKPLPPAQSEGATFLARLRFPPDIETAFQESYYARMRPTVRLGIVLNAIVSIGAACVQMGHTGTLVFSALSAVFLAVAVLNLLLVRAAFHPNFVRVWQPCVVAVMVISIAVPLAVGNESSLPFAVLHATLLAYRIQRLQLRWLLALLVGLIMVDSAIDLVRLHQTLPKFLGSVTLWFLITSVPLFFTFKSERFERSEFWTKYVLAKDRNNERDKREDTERMLHVLSQAIGGIVHDLGNPLTSVQSGAEVLSLYVQDGEPDKETLLEFAQIIMDGAQMLNFLRLSLMEQTRVLEGKPVPVELRPASLHSIVKAGIRYQKPIYAGGRQVSIEGDDLEVHVDEMRFVTVLMNLIGNALKYSDGEVRIRCHAHENHVSIAVLDQGRASRGISLAQAQQLFVPFGRLDAHAKVEGTGLGLLSVRKIAEAHGGEVYIEGAVYIEGVAHSGGAVHSEGAAQSSANCASWSTARGTYDSALQPGFCTAFVAACPLQIVPQSDGENNNQSPLLRDAVGASRE